MKAESFDLSRFVAPLKMGVAHRVAQCQRRRVGEFLKGPIPLSWLTPAAKLPGKALHVGLAIWFEHGRRKHFEFRLTAAVLRRFGIARKAGYRGLDSLERAGLIVARRQHGKNPVITLVTDCESQPIPTLEPRSNHE